MAANNGEVRHANALEAVAFFDQRHAAFFREVAGKAGDHPLHQFFIDGINNVEMPRHHVLHHLQRPALQRLRQQGVIGVRASCLRDLPGPLPFEAVLVDELSHQLGDAQRRMSVVHLDSDFLWELVEVIMVAQELPHYVFESARYHEIFLDQAQLFAGFSAVGGIEHARDIF